MCTRLLKCSILVFLLEGSSKIFCQDDFWQKSSGLLGGPIYSLAINSRGHVFAGTNGNKVFRSTDKGRTWVQLGVGLTNPVVLSIAVSKTDDSNEHLLAGTSGIFRSTDGGDHWTELNTGLSNATVFSLCITPRKDIFAGTAGAGIFRSTDNGLTWRQSSTPFVNTTVHALAASRDDDVFAGTGRGVFKSTDRGEAWTLIARGVTPTDVRALAINSHGHVLAGTPGGGVYRSTDKGESWSQVEDGLTNLDVRALAINRKGDIFAGTNGSGVFVSTNNGGRWTPVSSGMMGKERIWALAINSSGYVYAASLGGTVFRSVRSTTEEEEEPGFPSSYILWQNYPNPFNSGTTIEFSLPYTSEVTLKIYNTLGQHIETLVEAILTTGKHSTRWQPNGFASAAYFYRLEARATDSENVFPYNETKKLLLSK